MATINYCDGVYMQHVIYSAGYKTKNYNLAYARQKAGQLQQVNSMAMATRYVPASMDNGAFLQVFSYKTTVGYVVFDDDKKQLLVFDASKGYSVTTSKQFTIYKNYLARCADRMGYSIKHIRVRDDNAATLERACRVIDTL